MYIVYIIRSEKTKKYYVGQTKDIEERLKRHNSKRVLSTKNATPWKLVYYEKYSTLSEARSRENEIKKYKGGIKFKKLLGLKI